MGGDSGLEMSGTTQGGNDTLYGGDESDTLYGDATAMQANATAGNDTLYGEDGNDKLYGDAGTVYAYSGSHTATLGNDTLDGGAGDDTLIGDALGSAPNTIGGNDTLTGGSGGDTFGFDFNNGTFGDDTITDPGVGVTAVGGPDGADVVDGADTDVDTIRFYNVPDFGNGGGTIADLDAVSTVVDGGIDVVATVFPDAATKATGAVGTETGSITLEGLGDGTIDSFAKIDQTQEVEVVVSS
jgi:hypothetical protein